MGVNYNYGGYLTPWFHCFQVPEQTTECQREFELLVFIIKTLEWHITKYTRIWLTIQQSQQYSQALPK